MKKKTKYSYKNTFCRNVPEDDILYKSIFSGQTPKRLQKFEFLTAIFFPFFYL